MPASSLSGLSDRNVYAPPPSTSPSLYDYYRQGQQAVQSIFDQQNQAAQQQYAQQFRAQQLAEAQRQNDLQALLAPERVAQAQLQTQTDRLSLDQARLNAQPLANLDSGIPPTILGVGNISAPDESGFHLTVGTGFAGAGDLENFAKNGSLATGDNGKGAWGNNTTAGSGPQVALPPSFFKANGINPNKAFGLPVTLQLGDKTVVAKVGDKMPDNSKNGAGIDLNPDAAAALGGNADTFKSQLRFKLGAGPSVGATPPAATGAQVMPGVSSPSIVPVHDAFAGPSGVGIPLTLNGTAPFAPNLPTLDGNPDSQAPSTPNRAARTGTMTPQVGFYPNGDPTQPFVPTNDRRLAMSRGATLGTRLVPAVNPSVAKADLMTLESGRKKGLDPGDYATDENGVLTAEGRSALAADMKEASSHGGTAIPARIKSTASQMGIPIEGKSLDDITEAITRKQVEDGQIPPNLIPASQRLQQQILSHPVLKHYPTIREAKEAVDAAAGNPDTGGFADMAAVEGFQRMVNPGAVVRQGTIQNMREAAGYLQKLSPGFQWDHAIQGDKFTPAARERLQKLANDIYARYNANVGPALSGMKRMAKSYGIPNADQFVDNVLQQTPVLDTMGSPDGVNATATNPSTAPSSPTQISSKAQYDALASGAVYIAPDGSTRTKP